MISREERAVAVAVEEFRRRHGDDPEVVVRAPGRVNLIGEHTDYNEGFVLPMAIDRFVVLAARRRPGGRVHLGSIELNDEGSFMLGGLGDPERTWIDYARGVAWALLQEGRELEGFEGVLSSDVPVGAGLSSSAALEMAVARVFAAVSGIGWDALAMARAGQRAENAWLGVNCGIMDQLISAGARAGHATLIDCRTLEMRPVPVPGDMAFVVLDTSTRRRLADSAYNDRRAQCAAAALSCGSSSLRDVSAESLRRHRRPMGEVAFRRARHVVEENSRTLRAAEALSKGDAVAFGRLMNESHESLREDFEVSTPALDAMVQSARKAPGCHGARLTGAGLGGCVVALVARDQVDLFGPSAAAFFTEATGLEPTVYPCEVRGGAEVLEPPGL